MPWTKKAAAPATFNLQAAIAALITGDATWGWLLQWLPLVPQVTVDTAALCDKGPRVVAPFTAADFVADPHQAFDRALSQIGPNIDRIQSAAYDRVFEAYCENVVPAGGSYVNFFEGGPLPNTFLLDPRIPIPTPRPTQLRVTRLTADTGGFSDVHWVGYLNGSNVCNPTGPGMMPALGASASADLTVCPTINEVGVRTAGTGGTFRMEWFYPGGSVQTHPATPQPQPSGVVAPITNVYTSYADLGAELDRQELKLDFILGVVEILAQRGIMGPTTSDPPVPVTGAPVIAPGAIGYRIDVANIPAGAGEMFGAPPKYHRIGRYTLGSSNGYLAAVDLEHAQTLVAPLPPGIDRIQVVVNAPETATVTALYPPKVV